MLTATAALPDLADLARAFLFAGVSAAAQLRPIYLSQKIRVTAEDVATFAAALTFDPFLAGIVAGCSTLVALRTSPGEGFALRAFNAAVATLGTGCAAFAFRVIAPNGEIAAAPLAVITAGMVKYGVETALVDGAVALQLRRNPLLTWWPIHRRDFVPHAGLYLLGVLAAVLSATAPG